jgi:hypothetical protein
MADAHDSSPPANQQEASKASRPETRLVSEHLAALLNPALEGQQLTISEVIRAASAPYAIFRAEIERIYAPFRELERVFAAFAETLAPMAEERRIQQKISNLGFVPHAILFNHLGNVEKPSNLTTDEFSQSLADEVWPKIKTSLQLSIEDCLDDSKIYHTFNELIRAHDAGLYQLTAPSAFFCN